MKYLLLFAFFFSFFFYVLCINVCVCIFSFRCHLLLVVSLAKFQNEEFNSLTAYTTFHTRYDMDVERNVTGRSVYVWSVHCREKGAFLFFHFFLLLCCSFVRFCYAKRMAMTSSAKYRPSSTPHKPLELWLSLRSFCSHDSHFIKNQGGKCMVFALLNFVQKMIVVYVMWPPNTFTHARRTLTYIYIFIHLKKKIKTTKRAQLWRLSLMHAHPMIVLHFNNFSISLPLRIKIIFQ